MRLCLVENLTRSCCHMSLFALVLRSLKWRQMLRRRRRWRRRDWAVIWLILDMSVSSVVHFHQLSLCGRCRAGEIGGLKSVRAALKLLLLLMLFLCCVLFRTRSENSTFAERNKRGTGERLHTTQHTSHFTKCAANLCAARGQLTPLFFNTWAAWQRSSSSSWQAGGVTFKIKDRGGERDDLTTIRVSRGDWISQAVNQQDWYRMYSWLSKLQRWRSGGVKYTGYLKV